MLPQAILVFLFVRFIFFSQISIGTNQLLQFTIKLHDIGLESK
jgi:hypothetical protein